MKEEQRDDLDDIVSRQRNVSLTLPMFAMGNPKSLLVQMQTNGILQSGNIEQLRMI